MGCVSIIMSDAPDIYADDFYASADISKAATGTVARRTIYLKEYCPDRSRLGSFEVA